MKLCLRSLFLKVALWICASVGMSAGGLLAQTLHAPSTTITPKINGTRPQSHLTSVRSMVGGYWIIDSSKQSTIYIENDVVTSPIVATPILHLSDGTRIELAPVAINAAGVVSISVKEALAEKGISISSQVYGYLEVEYVWPWNALCISIKNTDPERSTIFVYTLEPKQRAHLRGSRAIAALMQSNSLMGFWWKEEPGVAAFVALANTREATVHADVTILDSKDSAIGLHNVSVGPHQTALLNLNELAVARTQQGGINITYDGPTDGLKVSGGLYDEKVGYSARLPLHFPPVQSKVDSDQDFNALDLMQGDADPMMSFPKGTSFTPYSVVRNISDRDLHITPSISWMDGPLPESFTCP